MPNDYLNKLALTINSDIFPRLGTNCLTVFLIGADQKDKTSLRDAVRKELVNNNYGGWIDVYYPEDLFEDLMSGKDNFDLLGLENLLASSVHVVVIILESPGSFAELGAFANHKQLKDKIVLIVDTKYKKANSFINLGPIKFLKKTKSQIRYFDFKKKDFWSMYVLGSDLRGAIRKVANNKVIDTSILNPVRAQYYLLSTLYVAGSIHVSNLNSMLKFVMQKGIKKSNSIKHLKTIFSSSLNILLSYKDVILRNKEYSLTSSGLIRLRNMIKREKYSRNIEKDLDKCRFDVLNKTLRKA